MSIKGRGRTKGATSFVSVTLKELIASRANPEASIPVNRRYAEMLGLKSNTMVASTKSLKLMTENPKVAVNVIDFNAEPLVPA